MSEQPDEATITTRKWCIEQAVKLTDDPWAVPSLAAALVEIVETGRLLTPAFVLERPIDTRSHADIPIAQPPEPLRLSVVADDDHVDPPCDVEPQDEPDGLGCINYRENQVIEAIVLLQATSGEFPSFGELADYTEIPRGSLSKIFISLEDKGYLSHDGGAYTLLKNAEGASAA